MTVQNSRYAAQAQGVEDDYGARSAANAYSRTLAQHRGQRGTSDLQRSYQRSLPRFKAQLGRRGLSGPSVRSGVASNALQRFAGDYDRGLFRMREDQQVQDQSYQLNQAQLDAQRERSLADIEAARQQEIALAALNLKAFAPLLGGY